MTIIAVDKSLPTKGRQRISWSRIKLETVAGAIQVHGCSFASDHVRLRMMDLIKKYIPPRPATAANDGDMVVAPFRDDMDYLAVGTVVNGPIKLQ